MRWKSTAAATYSLVIAIMLVVIAHKNACAGEIRKIDISPDRAREIRLAFGRTTAISFSSRPEKVVPGSPAGIEVNFLGKDVTIRPLSANPGNLLVYTKTSRFVLLLKVVNASSYDDVVLISPASDRTPIRVTQNTFRVVQFELEATQKKVRTSAEIPVLIRSNDQVIEGGELKEALRSFSSLTCQSCIFYRNSDLARLSCSKPIQEVRCTSSGTSIIFRRRPS